MTDPWANVRKEFKDVGDPLVDALLADAEALLVVKTAAQDDGITNGNIGALRKLREALAALPEYLKAEDNGS